MSNNVQINNKLTQNKLQNMLSHLFLIFGINTFYYNYKHIILQINVLYYINMQYKQISRPAILKFLINHNDTKTS